MGEISITRFNFVKGMQYKVIFRLGKDTYQIIGIYESGSKLALLFKVDLPESFIRLTTWGVRRGEHEEDSKLKLQGSHREPLVEKYKYIDPDTILEYERITPYTETEQLSIIRSQLLN